MPTVELDQDVYDYIAQNTKVLGEDASSILRRLLNLSSDPNLRGQEIEDSNTDQNDSVQKSVQKSQERSGDNTADALREILDIPKQVGVRERIRENSSSSSLHEDKNVVEPSRKVTTATHEQSRDAGSDTAAFLRSHGFRACYSVTDRYLEALRWIHFRHQQEFDRIAKIRGKKRIYFSQSESEIANSGNATQPRKIDGTRWYALTNNDSANKRDLLKQVMCLFHYPAGDVKKVTDAIISGK